MAVAGCNEEPIDGPAGRGPDDGAGPSDGQESADDGGGPSDIPSSVRFATRRFVDDGTIGVTHADEVQLRADEVELRVGSRTATWADLATGERVEAGDTVYLGPDETGWSRAVDVGDTLTVAVERDEKRETVFEHSVRAGTTPSLDCRQMRYGPGATGYHPDATGPTGPTDHWWLRRFDTWHVGSPLAVDGTVVAGTSDGLYGLDGGSLEVLWDEFADRVVVPAVADGRVYATVAAPESGAMQSLVALGLAGREEAWRAESLGERWQADLVVPTVNLVDGAVVVGEPGAAHCHDATTGDHRWSRRFAEGIGGRVSAGRDTVYLSAGISTLYALDLATGRTEWTLDVGNSKGVFSPPTVGENRLFLTRGNGRVYALDPDTGAVQWKDPGEERGGAGGVALVGDTVYCVQGERVFALDAATGTEQWATDIPVGFSNEPVVADGHVYVTSSAYDPDRRAREGSHLFVLDTSDGSVAWEERLSGRRVDSRPSDGARGIPGGPTVLDGVLLAPDSTGALHRFESL